MKFVTVAASVALLLQAPGAAAQVSYLTGNDLLRDCKSEEAALNMRCTSYILGVNDAMTTATVLAKVQRNEPSDEGNIMLCVPAGVEAGQLKALVIAYLERNPANRHEMAALLVYFALTNAYPCP